MNDSDKQPIGHRKWLIILMILVFTVIFGFLMGSSLYWVTSRVLHDTGIGTSSFQLSDNGYSGNSSQKLVSIIQNDAQIAETCAKVQGSVITILVDVVADGVSGQGIGSGVIFREEKDQLYIITNAHVVEDAKTIYFYDTSGEMVEMTLIGADEESDIAVVRLCLSDLSAELRSLLHPAELGDSDQLRSGEITIAIGSPTSLRYCNSVTVGVVSYPKREITLSTVLSTYIQTDTAINPGNSGGALFNEQGQVIGINSNKLATESIEGIGFAIPINHAYDVAQSLMEKGVIQYLSLGGIEQSTFLTDSMAALYHVPSGLVVYRVRSGSSAEAQGLRSGDIVTQIDGISLTSLEQFNEILLSHEAGDVVTVTVIHSRNTANPITVQLTLEPLESENETGSFWGTTTP